MTLVASDARRPGDPLVAGERPMRSTPPIRRTKASLEAPAGEPRATRRWLLGSRLYSMTLGYGSPGTFFAVAPDNWPGDPAIGHRLLAGELQARGHVDAVAPEAAEPLWQRAGAPPLWLEALNGF